MYSPSIQALISSARELGIEKKPTEKNPHAIAINGNRDDFPKRLWNVAHALEKLGSTPDRNFLALDCVMEMLKINGIDTQDVFLLLDMIDGKKSRKANRRISKILEEREKNMKLLGGARPSTPIIKGLSP